MSNDHLLVAGVNNQPEIFYTLEGEGRYIGQPSVFLRLSLCNLTCIGFKSPDAPFGCDSYVSWSVKNKMSFEEIACFFEKNGFDKRLREGAILKLTGGEPLIWQNKLIEFVRFIRDRWQFANFSKPVPVEECNWPTLRVDFETNGTIMPLEEWYSFFPTYTTSPKLSNNGDPFDKRYKPDVLKFLRDAYACFKFVVKDEKDLDEIYAFYIDDTYGINVPKEQIWLMPMCGSREELIANGTVVADMCKKHGFNFSNRLHLQLWNRALRV